jgi:hypothetical protein
MAIHVIGIDPGLVDTGIVYYEIEHAQRQIILRYRVVNGGNPLHISSTISTLLKGVSAAHPLHIFIEAYRPRHRLNTDANMVELVREIQKKTRGKVIPNTGIKRVVKPDLLKLLRSDKFSIASNHQDLLSAARIAVLGMLKDDTLNRVLSDVVRDQVVNSIDWKVDVS